MPNIFVYGTPAHVSQKRLETCAKEMIRIVKESGELNSIHTGEITVFFPPDRMKRNLGKEISVHVQDYFSKPELTPGGIANNQEAVIARRKEMVSKLRSCVIHTFPKLKLLTVVADPIAFGGNTVMA